MKLYAETAGQGRELVLLHGWSMNSAIWDGFTQHLGAGVRITRIDLPGHGNSPFSSHWDNLDSWVDLCLEVAPARAIWVGWSLGAMLCLQAARRAPQRLDRIIAIAGTPRFVQAADWTHAVPLGTLREFSGNLREDYRATIERFLALQVWGSVDARGTLRQLNQRLGERASPAPAALEVGLALLRGTDLRVALRKLSTPCFWLLGGRDTLVPAAVADDLKALRPETVVRVLPGAGHAPFLSHAEQTAAQLREVLE